jgi:hypothetical protein
VPAQRITLICIGEHAGIARFGGLGELTAAQLREAARHQRVRPADARSAARSPPARGPPSGAARTVCAHAPSPSGELRFLGEAFDRLSREYPSDPRRLSLTERRILAAVAERRARAGRRRSSARRARHVRTSATPGAFAMMDRMARAPSRCSAPSRRPSGRPRNRPAPDRHRRTGARRRRRPRDAQRHRPNGSARGCTCAGARALALGRRDRDHSFFRPMRRAAKPFLTRGGMARGSLDQPPCVRRVRQCGGCLTRRGTGVRGVERIRCGRGLAPRGRLAAVGGGPRRGRWGVTRVPPVVWVGPSARLERAGTAARRRQPGRVFGTSSVRRSGIFVGEKKTRADPAPLESRSRFDRRGPAPRYHTPVPRRAGGGRGAGATFASWCGAPRPDHAGSRSGIGLARARGGQPLVGPTGTSAPARTSRRFRTTSRPYPRDHSVPRLGRTADTTCARRVGHLGVVDRAGGPTRSRYDLILWDSARFAVERRYPARLRRPGQGTSSRTPVTAGARFFLAHDAGDMRRLVALARARRRWFAGASRRGGSDVRHRLSDLIRGTPPSRPARLTGA